MRKILFSILMLSVVVTCWRCSKDENTAPEPKIDMEDTTPITLPTGGGDAVITFNSTVSWSAAIHDVKTNASSSEFKIAPTHGEAGRAQITVSAKDPNETYDNQQAEVVITAGTATQKIAVTQKKRDALILTQNLYDIPYEGKTIEVELKSNVDYAIDIPDDAKLWISPLESKGLNTETLRFKVAPYGNGALPRSAKITFKDKVSALSDEVAITQEPTPTLSIEKSMDLTGDAQTKTIALVASQPWTITPDAENQSGCTISPTRGNAGEHTLSIAVENSYDPLTWTFQVKADTMVRTLKVTQAAKNLLVATPGHVTAKSTGETILVELKRSVACDVLIPKDATWVTQITSKAIITEQLQFKVEANVDYQPRSVEIVFRDQKSEVSDTVTITQASQSVPVVTDCWDIYDCKGSGYRYGPSIIINENGSIDAWFAAVGGTYGDFVRLYDEKTAHAPHGITGPSTVAQKFTADRPFWALMVTSPNWNNSPCGFTLSLYSWNDPDLSYKDVVQQEPVKTAKFVNYKDGEKLKVFDDDKFPKGTYLWVLSEGLTQHSGVWLCEGDMPRVTSYRDGEALNNQNWQAEYAIDETSGYNYWDQASYQRSLDGGKTWSKEVMTLKPTEFTSDHFSVCDPGAACWGGYYYIGYTSTENENMVENHAYVARSRNPDGPWEKWSGNGWGNDPKPVIFYDGNPKNFGAGEPSIVVVDNTVYFYYSWVDPAPTTRVATAAADDPNWPGNLTLHGTAMDKSTIDGADHSDVKYREDIGKFQAIHTAARMGPSSYIVLWQSDDGIQFTKIAELRDNLMPGLHNCGWSGDGKGHIKADVQQYIAYAYGLGTWGAWNTRLAKINW